jgi:hypothetical protein
MATSVPRPQFTLSSPGPPLAVVAPIAAADPVVVHASGQPENTSSPSPANITSLAAVPVRVSFAAGRTGPPRRA